VIPATTFPCRAPSPCPRRAAQGGVGGALTCPTSGGHRPLDVVDGCTVQGASDWLAAWRRDWLPPGSSPWIPAPATQVGRLPHAEAVVAHSHAVRLANGALDEVRRRVQQDTLGHRGRKDSPLHRIRRQLVLADERPTDRGWPRIEAGLAADDPAGEVGAAYLARELPRDMYATTSDRGPPSCRALLPHGRAPTSSNAVASPRSSANWPTSPSFRSR
jgi:hypothetical protein